MIARNLGTGENAIFRCRKKAVDGPLVSSEATASPFVTKVSLAEHLLLQKRLREEMERDNIKKLEHFLTVALTGHCWFI